MKRILSLALVFLFAANAWAYDFSAVAPSGQTLYFNISGQNATVTYPNVNADIDDVDPEVWTGFAKPTGALVIPSSVTYNGQTYTVTAIGLDAFWGCEGITSVTIHDSLTTIDEAAFAFCSSLTTATIGEGVTHLGRGAFFDCRSLTRVEFNAVNCTTNNANIFEYYDSINFTFSNNTSLTEVVFGNNVQRIPGKLLSYCDGISSLTIPASVTSLGVNVITGCNNLADIFALPATAPQLDNRAFNNANANITIHVPCGSLASYMSTWSYFSDFVEGDGSFQLSILSDNDEMGEVEILSMPDCSSPMAVVSAVAHDGFRFTHWSNGVTDNPYSITLTCDTALTAYFEADMPVQYTVTASANDASMGSVSGNGIFDEGTEVTLMATPNEGYRFVRWSNGATDNPYTFTLTCDTALTAFFEAENTECIQEADGTAILCRDGQLSILGAEGETVAVFDIAGRLILRDTIREGRAYALPESGVYLVRLGQRAAQKVVVTR